MDDSERTTKFAGFARLLWKELEDAGRYTTIGQDDYGVTLPPSRETAEAIIAQRAYDFMVSSHHSTATGATWEESRERVASVPDITAWPKPLP